MTPKEFMLAGDQLVTTCPSWEWKPASNDKLSKSELDKSKQYLYSKVPCQKRVKDLFGSGETTEKDVILALGSFNQLANVGRRWLVCL